MVTKYYARVLFSVSRVCEPLLRVLLESEELVARELVPTAPPLADATPELPPPAGAAPATLERVRDERLGLLEIGRRAAREAEGTVLREVLDEVHWYRVEAARLLRVSYKTLLQKMKEHGLNDGGAARHAGKGS